MLHSTGQGSGWIVPLQTLNYTIHKKYITIHSLQFHALIGHLYFAACCIWKT